MDLKKENVQMLRRKSQALSQVTFDSDCNVPDIKPDIGRIIQNKGMVSLEEVRIVEGKTLIKGWLQVDLLYVGEQEGKIHSFSVKLKLEESMNLEGLSGGDKICLKWEIEDISIHTINSRKVNIKAIVTFRAEANELKALQIPVQLDQGNISVKKEKRQFMNVKIHKKDTVRIREEILLASNRPNVQEILWYIVDVRSLEQRLEQNRIKISGELSVFVIYAGENENSIPQWTEYTIPFSESMECAGCEETMIPHIETAILQQKLEVRPDTDGEERIFLVDMVLEVDIKIYQEETMEILLDVYTPDRECIPRGKNESLDRLLIRNFSRCRVNDRIGLKEQEGKILQLCYSQGKVKVDRTQITEKGLWVEGVVSLKILYIMEDDAMPFYSMDTAIPFSYLVEAKGMKEKDNYYLSAELEQVAAAMAGNKEIEIRASVNLNTIVFGGQEIFLMEQIEEKELDLDKLRALPGILVYIVKPEDTLWNIAKKYFTTIEDICSVNEIKEEEIYPGQPLLLVKKVEK